MKRIIIALTAAVLSLQFAAGQLRPELLSKLTRIDSLATDAAEKKDYKGAIEQGNLMLATVLSLDEKERNMLGDNLISMYFYNLACYKALLGQRDDAIIDLNLADHYGYNDYGNMKADPDLESLRGTEEYASVLNRVKQKDFGVILTECAPYSAGGKSESRPEIRYADAGDANLKALRQRLNLDSVAGTGDEVSKIKNITRFVHNVIRHNGSQGNPSPRNGLAFIDSCANGRGTLNCRGMALLLNECLLSMGIPSRFITCFPKKYVNDCHVINAVYSRQLGRWIWMDPSFGAWVSDDQGNLLGLREVRQRLREGLPVVLNEEADHYQNKTSKEWYLDYYMTKNLYAMELCTDNIFGSEDEKFSKYSNGKYCCLVPEGFKADYTNGTMTSDEEWFWAAPE